MASYRIHNIRFYSLEPKSVTCLCHEPKTKKLALARLVNIYYVIFNIIKTHHFNVQIFVIIIFLIFFLPFLKER